MTGIAVLFDGTIESCVKTGHLKGNVVLIYKRSDFFAPRKTYRRIFKKVFLAIQTTGSTIK